VGVSFPGQDPCPEHRAGLQHVLACAQGGRGRSCQRPESPWLSGAQIPQSPFSGEKTFEPRRKIRSVRRCWWLCCCSCPPLSAGGGALVLPLPSTPTRRAVVPALSCAGGSVQEFPPWWHSPG